MGLFIKLKAWRAEQAKAQSAPAYVILSDKSLKLIAAVLPKDIQQLSQISGIGPRKLERYAADILEIVN